MKLLAPTDFFSLQKFRYKQLFEGATYVWEPLAHLNDFFQKERLGKIEVKVPEGVYLVHPELISIGEGTVIEPGSWIQGPCIIGKGCEIRHGAYVRGHVLIGDGCIIGHGSEIKRSIFLDETSAGHFNYVGDCILGSHVNLGAGVKCANLRLDQQTISVYYMGEKIDTGLKKFGAVIGDGAQLGCNSVTNPGTLIGKKSACHPCVNLSGFIPNSTVIKSNSEKNSHVQFS